MIDVERITPEDHEEDCAVLERKAAVESKSITEIIEEAAEDFCSNYCKYPDTWDEEAEGCELWLSKICAGCPVNRLV